VNEWPAGWARDKQPRRQSGQGEGAAQAPLPGNGRGGRAAGPPAAGNGGAAGADGEATVRLSRGGSGAQPGGATRAAHAAGRGAPAARAWPDQPPAQSGRPVPGSQRPRPPGPVLGGTGRGRRRFRPRLALVIVAGLVALVLVLTAVGYFYLDSKLHRINVLTDYSGRPAAGAGTNWLITGSDSRQGLTHKQMRQLATGFDVHGHRSDTVLLLHIPGNGGPSVLVSLPRDSYVPIPGHGMNKLNAAYAFGGPRLLVQTVQNVTGLRIDHYMGIGFGGLVNVVNAVGGVTLCFKHSLHDRAAGLHLHKGCQTLSGGQALGFVRTRHHFASQDLQREQNQRVFIRALLAKLTSPGTLINPFAVIPAAFGATGSLTVDGGTHLYQLWGVAFALRHPQSTTVPIANPNLPTAVGDAVEWNRAQALQLFNDLRTDHRVPKSLLTGSHLAG
jgi:LCP family protein required for cell wall assembly